jgi:hypothetical protein
MFACSGKYGQLKKAESGMGIEQLADHFDDYHVSYAGVAINKPTAVLFDPKGDDRSITLHPYWTPVKDRAELSEILNYMRPVYTQVYLYRVMGPGEQVFGYIFMLNVSPLIRVVDEKTLWIGNITLRNFEGAGQN